MVHETQGMHHLHKRKRIHQKLEKYPHPDKWKRRLDKVIYVVGILGPILTLPQLAKVWIDKNVAGVSLISWSAYLFTALFWLAYGIVHKEKPLIATYSLWILIDIFIVVGILIYS